MLAHWIFYYICFIVYYYVEWAKNLILTASENCRREDKLQIISHTPLASYLINYSFIILITVFGFGLVTRFWLVIQKAIHLFGSLFFVSLSQ